MCACCRHVCAACVRSQMCTSMCSHLCARHTRTHTHTISAVTGLCLPESLAAVGRGRLSSRVCLLTTPCLLPLCATICILPSCAAQVHCLYLPSVFPGPSSHELFCWLVLLRCCPSLPPTHDAYRHSLPLPAHGAAPLHSRPATVNQCAAHTRCALCSCGRRIENDTPETLLVLQVRSAALLRCQGHAPAPLPRASAFQLPIQLRMTFCALACLLARSHDLACLLARAPAGGLRHARCGAPALLPALCVG